MLTGVRADSFQNMQLGAGVFLRGFDADAALTAEQLRQMASLAIVNGTGVIGATRGGGTFRCVPKLRQLEADGLREPVKGATVCDGWTARMQGTMLEMTGDNLALALGAAEVTRSGGKTVIRPRGSLTDADYIDRLCWIGETVRGVMLIELTGALNMSGLTFTFGDKREGAMPFELLAHADAPGGAAPCRIILLEEAMA